MSRAAALLIFLVPLLGCGYSTGQDAGGHGRTIAVPVFTNTTLRRSLERFPENGFVTRRQPVSKTVRPVPSHRSTNRRVETFIPYPDSIPQRRTPAQRTPGKCKALALFTLGTVYIRGMDGSRRSRCVERNSIISFICAAGLPQFEKP